MASKTQGPRRGSKTKDRATRATGSSATKSRASEGPASEGPTSEGPTSEAPESSSDDVEARGEDGEESESKDDDEVIEAEASLVEEYEQAEPAPAGGSVTNDRLQLSTQRPQHPLHFVPGNWPAFHRNE